MQERLGRPPRTSHARRSVSSSAGEHALGREDVGRGPAPRSARCCGARRAGEQHAEVPALVGQRALPVGEVDGARLEQREVGGAARGVVAGGVEQRAEQQRAHDPTGPRTAGCAGARSAGAGRPRAAAGGRPRPGAWKLQPRISSSPAPASASSARRRTRCVGGQAPAAVAAARAASAGRRSSAVDPRDLLDEVDLARHVVAAPVRHASRRARRRRRRGLEAERRAGSRRSARAGSARRAAAATRASRRCSRAGAGPGPPTSIVPGTRRAPHSSTISARGDGLRLACACSG